MNPKEYYVGRNLYKEVPTIGAFEVFLDGELKFSKIKTRRWPNNIAKLVHEVMGIPYSEENMKQMEGQKEAAEQAKKREQEEKAKQQ